MNDKELIQAIRGVIKEELSAELTMKLGSLKEELKSDLKGDFGILKSDLKSDFEVFKEEIRSELKTDIKEEFVEAKQILRALEHSAEVNKSAHDAMQNDIAHIKGDFEELKDKFITVEAVTIDNWKEITKLKLAK